MHLLAAAILGVCVSCAPLSRVDAPASHGTPSNLGELKSAITQYVDSGDYERDLARVDSQAQSHLTKNAELARRALVLDIDETSLSNLTSIKSTDFGFILDVWNSWVESASAPAIPPTLELYRYAQESGFAVFFITGRSEAQRSATERNLKAAGFESWTGLFMRPDTDHLVGAFKTRTREQLAKNGWKLVANVGDQPSDLEGGPATGDFLLPNPFYRVH